MKYTSAFGFKLEKRLLDAGYDLRCPEDVTIHPGQVVTIDTGLCIGFNDDIMGLVTPKSGMGSNGMGVANTVGIIDPSYRGNGDRLLVKVRSWNNQPLEFTRGQKFAQIVFLRIPQLIMEEVDELEDTEDRGGFGSTGTH